MGGLLIGLGIVAIIAIGIVAYRTRRIDQNPDWPTEDSLHDGEQLEDLLPFRDRVIEPQLIRLRIQIRRLRRFIGRLRPLTPIEQFWKQADNGRHSDEYYRDITRKHRQK